ncbi:hypothetical protein P5673_007739, partial [Acropora cervicornis]
LKRDALATSAVQPATKRGRGEPHAYVVDAVTACTETLTSTSDVPVSMPFCPPNDMPDCPPDNVEPVQPPPLAAPTAEWTSLSMSSVTPEPPVVATTFATPATATEKCKACLEKSKKCSTLRKGNLRLRRKVAELKQTIRELQSRVPDETEEEPVESEEEPHDTAESNQPYPVHAAATCMSSADTESDIEEYNDEIDYTYASAEESTESENNFDGNPEESSNSEVRVDPDMPEYEQPKFIVFYWQLVGLFTMFCFKCREARPSVTMKSFGTMVTATQHCMKCKQSYEWQSQPTVHGKFPLETYF